VYPDRWSLVKVLLVAALLAASVPGGLTPREPSARSVVFREEAVIAADPARVWGLLVNLDGYRSWNPWVVAADGAAEPGADVTVDVMLGGHRMHARHTVLTVRPEAEFCWKDAGWNSWFVYGQRCRWLEQRPDGTVLFRQELLLDGPLSGMASLTMGKALRDGMAAETAALKAHAES
jgi:uncharacterized protein YndB with AHSA1/START domain